MGKASSSKKVARAARAGGSSKGATRNFVWPATMAVLVVVGVALIVFSRSSLDDDASAAPLLGDHWHAAYGLSVCGQFAPPLVDLTADTSGIHSHGDGLIHLHPFSTRYTGAGANLDAFGELVGLELSDTSLEFPGQDRLENGDDCNGEPGIVQVKVWEGTADQTGRLLTADVGNFAPQDGDFVTIAFAPEGADIPIPPSAGTPPSDVPGAEVTSTVPTDTSSSVPADSSSSSSSVPDETSSSTSSP